MDRLTYFPGSPFARMARVLVIEWRLPVEPVQAAFPDQDDRFDGTPLGQVPALLTTAGQAVFPAFMVLERLWEMARCPEAAYRPETERQLLHVVLQAGDGLVTSKYIGWTGLEPAGVNHVGYDLAARSRNRFRSALDWLAMGRLRDGLTLPGVAAAALVLWADARGGGHEPVPPAVRSLTSGLAGLPGFRQTLPQAWAPGG